jgi:hypothetical protein
MIFTPERSKSITVMNVPNVSGPASVTLTIRKIRFIQSSKASFGVIIAGIGKSERERRKTNERFTHGEESAPHLKVNDKGAKKMQVESTIYDRLTGLKPVDKDQMSELEVKIQSVLPELIEAVEQREILAAASRYREIEMLKGLLEGD